MEKHLTTLKKSELTDFEIRQIQYLHAIASDTKSIKNNLKFFFYLSIVFIATAFFFALFAY